MRPDARMRKILIPLMTIIIAGAGAAVYATLTPAPQAAAEIRRTSKASDCGSHINVYDVRSILRSSLAVKS